MKLRIKRLSHSEGLPLPSYATEGSAGLDLRAALTDPLMLDPGHRELIPTGLIVEIPPGFEGQVRARSGLAYKHGLGLPNAPGTIDSDYRGELKVLLVNWGDQSVALRRGDRVAQLVVTAVERVEVEEVRDVVETERGDGGFGHTGTD